uniref:PDZ domain-containing protein n=1 Tax=Attheya septentrionalis TaxID=420275 RepID=A0A7S2UPB9_9STRA|mmetsp:Transcript_3864/g.6982  ORF Transcript_3864/g.6982 Transcript_3864/m.6982 type:complete len:218 (+) Transcript_3864:184-837(+)
MARIGSMTTAAAAVLMCSISMVNGFTGPVSSFGMASSTTQLQMGLFDGVKDAFSAPPSSTLGSERETPIDRWMGWNVKKEDDVAMSVADDANFVDSMDPKNFVAVELQKPMGIIFQENEGDCGGISVLELREGGAAFENSFLLEMGDQLVAVGSTKVSGQSFDTAIGAIVDATPTDDNTGIKLVLFRGSAKDLYGPTGASQEWLDEFLANGAVPVSK